MAWLPLESDLYMVETSKYLVATGPCRVVTGPCRVATGPCRVATGLRAGRLATLTARSRSRLSSGCRQVPIFRPEPTGSDDLLKHLELD